MKVIARAAATVIDAASRYTGAAKLPVKWCSSPITAFPAKAANEPTILMKAKPASKQRGVKRHFLACSMMLDDVIVLR